MLSLLAAGAQWGAGRARPPPPSPLPPPVGQSGKMATCKQQCHTMQQPSVKQPSSSSDAANDCNCTTTKHYSAVANLHDTLCCSLAVTPATPVTPVSPVLCNGPAEQVSQQFVQSVSQSVESVSISQVCNQPVRTGVLPVYKVCEPVCTVYNQSAWSVTSV